MFYAGSAASLKQELKKCFKHRLGPGKLPNVEPISQNKIVTLVCPHAGYMYSGPVAAASYYELARYQKPDNIVIIGPNHTGMGSAISLMNRGKWSTPLGEIQINEELADSIIKNSPIVDMGEEAHIYEHSIEVQLPFLQYLYGNNFLFAPVCMMMQDLETSRELGEAIHKASNGKSTLIIASTDMTHYEPHNVATEKDMNAWEIGGYLRPVEVAAEYMLIPDPEYIDPFYGSLKKLSEPYLRLIKEKKVTAPSFPPLEKFKEVTTEVFYLAGKHDHVSDYRIGIELGKYLKNYELY